MSLVTCRRCKNTVAAASPICPVCGQSFRAAAIRRVVMWGVLLLLVVLFFCRRWF